MDSIKLHEKFRKQLTTVHALTVLTVLLFEIIGYIVLIYSGKEKWSADSRFLWFGVVVPSAINAVTHLIARAIVNAPATTPQQKNNAIIGAALSTAFVVAVFHKEYIVTCCAFVFPMILSAMFNDKKLLTVSLLSSLFILICVGALFRQEGGITLTVMLNLLVLFGFALVSFFCGVISINFSKLNDSVIRSQEKKNNQLREDLLRDQMTGLYAHQAFLSQLKAQTEAADSGMPFCVVMMDLDDFKQVNDTYGHDCGDEVLLFFAKALQKHCEVNDTAYRYGGEEFAIIYRQKSARQAYETVKEIQQYVQANPFGFMGAPVTFSAGIAQYTDGMTGEALFEAADKTLYTAKRAGKNRVCINESCTTKTAR